MTQRTPSLVAILVLVCLSALPSWSAGPALENGSFRIEFGEIGITSLTRPGDAYPTDYIREGNALGNISLRFRMEGAKWQEAALGRMSDRRPARESIRGRERIEAYQERYYLYHGDFNDHYADLELVIRYRLESDGLYWTIRLRNLSGKPLTVGDLCIPLPFNTERRWNTEEMLTRRVYAHSFVSGHGSFAFWMRPNSVGPFLVMVPLGERPAFEPEAGFRPTALEYFDERGVFIHSVVSGQEAREMGGTWRQAHTSVVLTPAREPGSEAAYGFKFRWADGYRGVRDVLVEEGLFDIQVVPGMTVPSDLEALFSIRTKQKIERITPEHPAATALDDLGEKAPGTRLYRVRFSRLGENMLTVEFGDGRKTYLEFLSTEPLETLIKKRAAHLVARQQHRDPDKWYNGLFSDWDMRNRILRSPDDTDGLKQFWMSCDDPGLCKAPFIAAKNAHFPDRREIEAVEYYIQNFLWGKQQRTDRETLPYGIYGIPNWKVNRESRPEDRDGWVGHLWRLYDYPHVIMLYLNMYRVARNDPGLTSYLDKDGYLERAFGTAKAYFTVPLETGNWSANSLGTMAEVVIGDVIEALASEGKKDEERWLRAKWEEKIEHFINDRPNFFYAEYPFGPCAFESTHAFARYAMERAGRAGSTLRVTRPAAESFLEDQIAANIVLRGWLEPAYYLLGSSSPGSLFYMTQMGGWSLVDHALRYAKAPEELLRLGYASYLCGWGLMNTGPPDSDFGPWYPGRENDGGAGTGFTATAIGEKLGKLAPRGVWYYGGEADMGFGAGLRTAATVVVEDPLFGPFAYGGRLTLAGDAVEVIPRDGLRQRFHVIRNGRRFHMELDKDGFAREKPIAYDRSFREIRCVLEKRFAGGGPSRLELQGLPEGPYEVRLNGAPLGEIRAEKEARSAIDLTLPPGESVLSIRRAGLGRLGPKGAGS